MGYIRLKNPPSPVPGSGLVRQLPFPLALQAKLLLIAWAAGGKKATARKLGVTYRTVCRWNSGKTRMPGWRSLQKVDEAYAVAFERRCVHEHALLRRRLREKAKASPPDMNISIDAV